MGTAAAIGLGGLGLIGGIMGNRTAKTAARAQQQGQDAALAASQQAADLARSQAIPLFNAAQQNQQQGFQGALDIFGQTIPAQINAFTSGNQNAQNTLLAGLSPQMQAILGGQIDLSGLQAQQAQAPDPSIFQQQLPDFTTIDQALNPQSPQSTILADMRESGRRVRTGFGGQNSFQPNSFLPVNNINSQHFQPQVQPQNTNFVDELAGFGGPSGQFGVFKQ